MYVGQSRQRTGPANGGVTRFYTFLNAANFSVTWSSVGGKIDDGALLARELLQGARIAMAHPTVPDTSIGYGAKHLRRARQVKINAVQNNVHHIRENSGWDCALPEVSKVDLSSPLSWPALRQRICLPQGPAQAEPPTLSGWFDHFHSFFSSAHLSS